MKISKVSVKTGQLPHTISMVTMTGAVKIIYTDITQLLARSIIRDLYRQGEIEYENCDEFAMRLLRLE